MEINNNNGENISAFFKSTGATSGVAALPLSVQNWIEENSSDAFLLIDENGKIVYATKAVETILSYRVHDLLGTVWTEKIPDNVVFYIREQINAQKNDRKNFVLNVLNNDGNRVLLECVVEGWTDGGMRPIHYLVYLKDITHKKETEEMMVRSEKMTVAGQLAAGIAHEIRNPLTSLKGFLQLMQAGVDRKEEYFSIMIDEIEKIEAITSELLYISKPLTDNKKLEPVRSMLEDIATLLLPQASQNNIEILIERPVEEEIICDRSQIKQVLINLVKNAIEAMDASGKIILSTEQVDGKIIISVKDEGCGIATDILHKLGEPFFTTKQSGTGLGLLITKQILEAHHAHLEIKQNPTKGSTFQLIFTDANE
ncbi:ATP-binding protein [Oceanobacillus sp. FSL K6-2867]|uniref:ATP-binding protein n=1 Tax=Oceanobacillus sp. FSL K6-2867 TaxID=2954748 RepID=UPI0030DC057B